MSEPCAPEWWEELAESASVDAVATRGRIAPIVFEPGRARDADAASPLPDDTRRALIERLGLDPAAFARTLFPAHFRLPFSRLHRLMLERKKKNISTFCPARRGTRLAVAAPRGAAKSTLASFLFPLHDFLYAQERYIVLISATLRQAERRLAQIRAELAANDRLLALFPELSARRAGGLLLADSARTLRAAACRIDAFSAGTELRGLADGPWRPTKIVLDDAEPNDVAFSPLLRRRLHEWFSDVIEPLGDAYTHIEVVGTLLHPESLLARLLERPDVEAHRVASVVSFAAREDLWERWRAVLRAEGGAAARAFFEARRDAMLAGADVLWPEREDYHALMMQLEAIGRRAFMKEKQNEPRVAEGMLFDPEAFAWFEMLDGAIVMERSGATESEGATSAPRIPLASLTIVAFLDSATGAGGPAADDAAIVVVGARGGDLFALDAWMQPVPPTRQVEAAWTLHDRWGLALLGYESNAFQSLLAPLFEASRRARRTEGRRVDLPLRPVHHAQAKEQRILALQPLVETGVLAFRRGLPPAFVAQVEQWPHAAHDDAIDALAAAATLARSLAAPGAPQHVSRRRGF